MRALVFGMALLVAGTPANARLWKPTPIQIAQDYATITHIKGADGRVVIAWMASPLMTTPTMKQLLDRYILLSIIHTRPGLGGTTSWDDIEGVQVTDSRGQPLKEITGDAIPPSLVGLTASADASMRQGTQGRGKMRWGIYEAGPVNACQPGKLVVTYDGESYNFDTPIPGCAKP